MTVLDKVTEITADQHDVDKATITSETHFFEDFSDSLDFVEIIMACEETFDIKISDDDLKSTNLETVGRLATYIEDKLKQRVTERKR